MDPLVVFRGPSSAQGYLETLARYANEEETEARAAELGVGSTAFLHPVTATLGSYGQFR